MKSEKFSTLSDLNGDSSFMLSLGFPKIKVHNSFDHFDFSKPNRRILVVGPMGSGKTEFSARVWRDAKVLLNKSAEVSKSTMTNGADRRIMHFVRHGIDKARFSDYPEDALPFRGGYEHCGDAISSVADSFGLEEAIRNNPQAGTWVIDETSFYDERIAYLIRNESESRGLVFILPTLVLNFRKEIFNRAARLLLENATDMFPLTAYCEHPDCISNSLYTYRYYNVDGIECPALYFDPLIIIGGDKVKNNPLEPNYCTRCNEHHYLPGKQYTFFTLKPLGEVASQGNIEPLKTELIAIKENIEKSILYKTLKKAYVDSDNPKKENMNSLLVPCIPEKALCYLYAEENLLSQDQLRELVNNLDLNKEYLNKRLSDNRRPFNL